MRFVSVLFSLFYVVWRLVRSRFLQFWRRVLWLRASDLAGGLLSRICVIFEVDCKGLRGWRARWVPLSGVARLSWIARGCHFCWQNWSHWTPNIARSWWDVPGPWTFGARFALTTDVDPMFHWRWPHTRSRPAESSPGKCPTKSGAHPRRRPSPKR